MKMKSVITASCLLGALLASCKEDMPSIPAPAADPCAISPSSKYYFSMKNLVRDTYFTSDTIFPGDVLFSAPAVYKSVSWKIGNDARTFNSSNLKLNFPTAVGTIVVRLIGARTIDKCILHDQGIDTIKKTLTVMPFYYRNPRSAIEGIFLGVTDNAPADTFRINIHTQQDHKDTADYAVNLYNLNKGCPGLDMGIYPAYKALTFNQSRGDATCHGVYGYAQLDSVNRNKIRVVYQEQLMPGQPQYAPRVFIGYRKK